MTYILIINKANISCATDQYLLTKEQAKHIDNVGDLIEEIEQLGKKQQQQIEYAECKGYEKGYKEGLNKSIEEMNIQFSEYLESMSKRLFEVHTQSQQSIIDLAVNITKKIASDIGSEEMVTGLALRAIKNLKSDKLVEIKVNSEIAEFVEKKLNNIKLTDSTGSDLIIEIIDDPNIGKFDCVITTDRGITEASFEEQLKLLKQQLSRVMYNTSLDT